MSAEVTISGLPVPFDPNEGREGKSPFLPNLPGMSKAFFQDVNDYCQAFEDLAKSLSSLPPSVLPYDKISFLPDPSRGGILQPPGLAPESILKICRENIAPTMIIQERIKDVIRYSELSNHPWKPGWDIELMEGSKHPSSHERRDMRDCERFILNCNIETGYDQARKRDAGKLTDFGNFLAATVRDTLRFDGIAIWTDMDSLGRVAKFSSLPAGNIRLCGQNGYMNDPTKFAVLVDDAGSPQASFTRDELIWSVRNPRNDAGITGYGYAEVEMGVRLIQAFQNALDLNAATFDKNGIPNGMFKLTGDAWSDKPLDALARMWTNMKKGISKYWTLPAIGVPEDCDLEVLNLNDLKDTDVRYKDHMNMVIGVFCTIYGFPVTRLGYHTSGSHRDNKPEPDGSIALVGDDDPGLAPLLIHFEKVINQYLVWSRWPHLKFAFTAKHPVEDQRGYEEAKQSQTWNERRAENDKRPLTEVCEPKDKRLMEIMGMCPADSNMAAVFQTLAVKWLEITEGVADGNGDSPASPGARTGEKVDPAKSAKHGHVSGVRRNSRAEKKKSVKSLIFDMASESNGSPEVLQLESH